MDSSLTSLRRMAARLWNLPSTLLRSRRVTLPSVGPADADGFDGRAARDQAELEPKRFVAEFDLLRGRGLADLQPLGVKTRR